MEHRRIAVRKAPVRRTHSAIIRKWLYYLLPVVFWLLAIGGSILPLFLSNSEAVQQRSGQSAKLITVIGCGGNRDKGKRPMMAQIAKRGSEQLILTSDNPRDEEPADILKDMTNGLTPEELRTTLVIEDRAAAIQTACTLAQPGDVILIAGKGHEDYQIVKGVKHHFDDHDVVKKYL